MEEIKSDPFYLYHPNITVTLAPFVLGHLDSNEEQLAREMAHLHVFIA